MKKTEKKSYHPQFVYEKEDDVLNIWFSRKKIDYAEQSGDIIVHFTEDKKPVYIEILDASRFLKREGEDLPQEIKQKFFSLSP